MKTLHFTGNITLLEPFTVSLAKQGGLPKFKGLSYIPQSTINGAIRHSCLNYLVSQAKKEGSGHPYTLETYLSTSQGYVLNNELKKLIDTAKTSTPIDKDDDIRQANPALSLFGRWKLGGKFGIGNAYTSSEADTSVVEQGFRSDIFERDPNLLASLPDDEMLRYYALKEQQSMTSSTAGELKKEQVRLLKSARAESDREKKEILYKQANDIAEQISAIKSETAEGKENLLRPLDDAEFIVAGAVLNHRMTLRRVSDEEIGLALLSLAQFSLNPRLGGKARKNSGLLHAQWDVKISNEETFGRDVIGQVRIDDEGFHVEGEMLTNSIAKFKNGKFDYSRII
tara:strand:- start:388 stop:1410 length:1023 start_codon:yes stop_codon:yes gene_type:complete